jgi:peptidoglycan hydrolase CwlO-like protein
LNNPHLPRAARSAAVLTVALFVGALLSAPSGADTDSQLAAAKAQLKRLITRISVAQDTLSALQSQANEISAQIDAVQSRVARVQGQIVAVRSDIAKAGKELDSTQAQLDRRAWVAYENGPAYTLGILLGANSLSDLSDRLAIINATAKSDRALIEEIQGLQADLRLRKAKLANLQTGLRADQEDLGVKQKSLQSKLSSGQHLLTQLGSDKADAATLVNGLEQKRAAEIAAEKQRLASLAAAQEGTSHGGTSIGGVFQVCPVDQPRSYSDDFGAPRYSGGIHTHAGNDIFAARGTPIRATFSGTAADATNTYGGLSVKVYGRLGYTYNAHMTRLGHLGSVSAGDIIGYVGDSGDALGGATHDHFEWHPDSIPSPLWISPYGYGLIGSAIDPYPYLNAVC